MIFGGLFATRFLHLYLFLFLILISCAVSQNCGANSYSLPGGNCSKCVSGVSTFVSNLTSCAPSAGYGPIDTSFFFSGDSSEGIDTFVINAPSGGVGFGSDRFARANRSLYLSGGWLSSPRPLPSAILPAGSSDRTVSLWLQCNPTNPNFASFLSYGIRDNQREFSLHIRSGALIGFETNEPNTLNPYVSDYPVCDGIWHHIVVISMYVRLYIFIDGNVRFRKGQTDEMFQMWTTQTESPSFLNIGKSAYSDVFSGALDDVRIYQRALMPIEIVQLYRSNSTWMCPRGPYYRLLSSTICSLCARDASPSPSDFMSCLPSNTTGPSDTLLYLSFDAYEGLDALTNLADGLSFAADNFGNSDGALQLINGAKISFTFSTSSLVGTSTRSLLFWLQCAAPFVETSLLSSDAFWTGLSVSALNGRITRPIDLSMYSSASICDGTWHHFAMRYDGLYVSIFVDSAFIIKRRWIWGGWIYNRNAGDGTLASYNAMFITLSLNGAVDDLRIYDRALSTSEISQIFRRSTTWTCPVGSYRLPGSSSCGICKSGTFISSEEPCSSPLYCGPSDTSFYFSFDKSETYNAFSPRSLKGLKWIPDRFGSPNSALYFSGEAFLSSPDVLNTTILPTSTSSFSVSVWFSCSPNLLNPATILSWGNALCDDEKGCPEGYIFRTFFPVTIIPKSNSIGIQSLWNPHHGSSFREACPYNCLNYYPSFSLCDNEWHHLAIIFTPKPTVDVFLDGSFTPMVAVQQIFSDIPPSHLMIGAFLHGYPIYPFIGGLDDLRIYKRNLSPAEISQIFNSNSTWKCPTSGYRLPGSSSCSFCGNGSIINADSSMCTPIFTPVDTSFYHSLSKAEGLGVFTRNMPLGISWTRNRFGTLNSALRFPGTDTSFLISPDVFNATVLPPVDFGSSITISFWLNCNVDLMSSEEALLSWGLGAQHVYVSILPFKNFMNLKSSYYNNENNYYGSRLPFKIKMCDATWHHVSIIYNRVDGYVSGTWKQLKVYIDGTLESTSWCFFDFQPPSRLQIGGTINSGKSYHGMMSDLQFYSRVLLPSELFNNGQMIACPPGGYRLPGSPACGLCVNGAMPSGDEQTCSPSIALGPSDTSFFFSFDAKETLGAYSASKVLAGLTWVTDRYGTPNSALYFSGESILASPGQLNSSILPSGTNFKVSISLWILCDASQMKPKVVFFSWGTMYSQTCSAGSFAPYYTPGTNKIYFQTYFGCNNINAGDVIVEDVSIRELKPSTPLCDRTWHHIVFVVDPSAQDYYLQTSIFVDGILEDRIFSFAANVKHEILSPSHLMFGSYVGHEWNPFSYTGALDDFRIYPRVLSSSEILSLYLPPLAPITPPSLDQISLFVKVGLPGAVDSTCNATKSCASISAALLIAAYNSSLRGIAIYSSSIVTAPFILPSSLQVGFAFIGANTQPTTMSFSTSSTVPCTLLSILGDSITISNFIFDGGGTRCCENAVFLGGVFNYIDNVHFRNFNCSHSLIATTIAKPGRVAKNTSMAYPAISISNTSFTNSAAPIYARAWNTPSLQLSSITALHTSSTPASFLALDSALSLKVFGSKFSGFSSRSPLPTFGSGKYPLCGATFLLTSTASVSISSLTISNVSASSSGGAALCIYGATASVTIKDLQVYNSSARENGGSISIDCRDTLTSAGILISNSSFFLSTSLGSGGSVFIANAIKVNLESVIMTESSAANDGGAVAILDVVSVHIVRGSITKSKSGGSGGALYIQDSAESIIEDVVATSNSAREEGGAISCISKQPFLISINGVDVFNNSATFGGGGLSLRSSSRTGTLSLNIKKTAFRGNFVTDLLSSGGALLCVGSEGEVSLLDSTFDRNRAAEGGGAFFTAYIGTYMTVSIIRSTFLLNTAIVRGGGLMASVIIVSLIQNSFISNSAYVKGGGACVSSSDLTIDSSIFLNNSVVQFGGGITVESCVFRGLRTTWTPPSPTIVPVDEYWLPKDANGTVFINNNAGKSGGAIFVSTCQTQLSFLILGSNFAGESGGGIYIDSSSITDFISLGPLFASSNVAAKNGGTVMLMRSSSDMSMCTWPLNVSAAGHAAWLSRAAHILDTTAKHSGSTLTTFLAKQVSTTIPPFVVARKEVTKKFEPLSSCPMPLILSNTSFFSTVSSRDIAFSYPFAQYGLGSIMPYNRQHIELSYFWLDPNTINETLNSAISVWPNSGICILLQCQTIAGALPTLSNFSSGHSALYFSPSTSLTLSTFRRLLSTSAGSFLFALVTSFDGTANGRSFGSGCDSFIGSWQGRYGCFYVGNTWLTGSNCAGPIVNSQVYVTVLHCAFSTCSMWVNDMLVYSGDVGNRVFPSIWSFNNICEPSSFLTGDFVFKRNIGFNESKCISSYLCNKYDIGNCSSSSECLFSSSLFTDDSGSKKTLSSGNDWSFESGKGVILSSRSTSARLPTLSIASNVSVCVVWTWDGSNDGVRIIIGSSLGNAYLAQNPSDSTIGFFSDGVFISSGFVLEDNVQYSLTLVAQGSNFTLYVDGIPILRSTQGFNISEYPPVFLGNGDPEYLYSGSTQTATGILHDVRVWLRVLSESEISLHNVVRSPLTLISGSSIILNQIVSTPKLILYEESPEGCNITNTTYYPDVLTAILPSPKEILPFSCVFFDNKAQSGGDASFLEANKVLWTNSLSFHSSASLRGGSASFDSVSTITLSNIAFNQTFAGESTSGIDGIKGSTGGALMIRQPMSLALKNISFSGCMASNGGGLWLERQSSIDSVSLSGLSFVENHAWFGGEDVYYSSGVPPYCSECYSFPYTSNSSRKIINAASGPRKAVALSSPYFAPFGSGSNVVNALVIVGSVPIAAPLLSILLLDVFGAVVSSDNSSVCEVSGIRNDTQGILALGFSDTYVASGGIVRIFPFSIENGPGMPGLLSVKCIAAGEVFRELPVLYFPLATSIVSVSWTAPTLALPHIYILPSTANEAYPPTRALSVSLIDNSGSTISAVSVRCSLSIIGVVDSQGRLSGGAATLVGNNIQSSTIAGIATFLPGVQAPSNSTISISASCTWISGDSVSTATPLLLKTYALEVLWSDSGSTSSKCSCGILKSCDQFVCAAVELESMNLSDTHSTIFVNETRWMSIGDGENLTRLHRRADDLSLTDPADVPAALPSSTDTSTLQALFPPPKVAILQLFSNGYASVVSQFLTCTITIATEFLATENARGGLERIAVSPIAAITGSSSVITQNGQVSFDSIGVRGAGFGSAIPMITSCRWITGEILVSLPLLVRLHRLRTRLLVSPPISILPSNPSTIFPWTPSPQLIVEYCFKAVCTNDLFAPFLAHPMTCIASISSSGVSDNLLQLLGTVFTQVNVSSGLATYTSLSAAGNFGTSFFVTFSCMWVSGDAAIAISPLISFPLVQTSWFTNVNTNNQNETNEEQILSGPPPSYALYNTPLLPVGVSLTYILPNKTFFNYSRSNFSLISEHPENELVCRLGATVNGSPILITGVTEQTASSFGILTFPNIALMPVIPTALTDPMPNVLMTATCTARGNALPLLTATTIVQRLIVAFKQAPPQSTIPASVSQPFPFSPPVSVAIINATGGVLLSESSASCTVTVIAEDFSPSVSLASRQITLLGTVRSPVNFGVAFFPGLSVNAPLGSSATLSFACTRNAGGVIFSATANVIVEILQAVWLPPTLFKWQLFNTPTLISSALLQFVPDPTISWKIASNEIAKSAPGVSCSLMLESPTSSGLSIVVSSPGKIGATGLSDINGILSFSLSLTGTSGRFDNVSALCSVAGQYFSTPHLPVAIENVLLISPVPPPSVWLPSFPGASTPFSPIPAILLVRQHGQAPVDAREAACQMSVNSPNASVLDPPLSGYKLTSLISTRVDSSGAIIDNETELTYLASTTPIFLRNALVQSNSFGVVLDMSITCQRSQGDTTAPYLWKLRIVDADVEFFTLPPSSIVSQTAFSLQLRLFDRGSAASTLELDNVTTCIVTVTTPDPSIILQNGNARAIQGIVKFLGITLAARSGFIIQGVIICNLGQLVFPTLLPWKIVMAPCVAGTAPAGGGGYTCAACPSSTYSDGGIGVAACTACPSQGVSCAGGLLVLLPGFSRTQDGASTLDAKTELRPCWNSRGCWVNLNNSDKDRSANHTHGCLKGYSGPLCGVCSIDDNFVQSSGTCIPCGNRAFNLFIISLLPIVILSLVVWISLYRKVIASTDSQVLLRILLTYIQTMGTLSSVYFARGTEAFRALFGFTTAMGDSPLTLASVQCELRIPFYARFGVTVTLPFTVVILVLITNVSALALKRHKNQENSEEKEEMLTMKNETKAKQAVRTETSAVFVMSSTQYWKQFVELIRADILRFFADQSWVAPVIFVLNASYSSLTTTSFNVFNCMPYSVGGVYYLAQDLSVVCFDRTHNIFRGIAGVLIACFGAGFPILFAVLLHRNRLELHIPEVFEKLGFLFDGYSIERGWYAWESVTMVRKAGIVMIGSLIKDEYNQIFASVSLLVIALFLQANFQPYEKRFFNYLEGVALVTVMLTQLISMFYLRSDSQLSQCVGQESTFVINVEGTSCGEIRATSQKNEIITTASLALVNILFLVGIFWLMIRMWFAEMKNTSTKTTFVLEAMDSVRNRFSDMFSSRSLSQSKLPLSSTSSLTDKKSKSTNKKIRTSKVKTKDHEDCDLFTEVVNPLRNKTSKSFLLKTHLTSTMENNDDHKLAHSTLDAPLAAFSHNDSEAIVYEKEDDNHHQIVQGSRSLATKVAFSPLSIVSESSIESSVVDNDQKSLHQKDNASHNLPKDWIQHSDSEGNVWYENTLTTITQWEVPLDEKFHETLDEIKVEGDMPLEMLWVYCEDDTGDVWFKNVADPTQLEWTLPEGHKQINFEEFFEIQRRKEGEVIT